MHNYSISNQVINQQAAITSSTRTIITKVHIIHHHKIILHNKFSTKTQTLLITINTQQWTNLFNHKIVSHTIIINKTLKNKFHHNLVFMIPQSIFKNCLQNNYFVNVLTLLHQCWKMLLIPIPSTMDFNAHIKEE